jgi:hypothetical protein
MTAMEQGLAKAASGSAPREVWFCRILSPESAWEADPVMLGGKARDVSTAAVDFARARVAEDKVARVGRAIVECQAAATLYQVHIVWAGDKFRAERVDRVG